MPRIPLFATAAVAVFLAGCGSDTTAPRSELAGTYRLFAVDQLPLPADVMIDGVLRVVTSGSLTVNDTAYHYSVCVVATGATNGSCGSGHTALVDSGRVVSAERGPSFIGWTNHASRALIVSGDTLTFQRNDSPTPRLDFVR